MSNNNKTYNTLEEWKAAFTHHCVIKPKKNMLIEKIAQVAHEVNKAYCEAIGDKSQTSWEDAPAWQKESAVLGVMFHVENPDAGPDASHNSWMKQKVDTGWVYGEEKDPEAKTHPCIVPFEELSLSQQVKDYLFRQVVHSLKDSK
jgi:hypothetical protein